MPFEGFYSIVLPWYGCKGITPLEMCGIHRFQNGRFSRMSVSETVKTFIILPTMVDLRSSNDHRNV